MPSRPAKKFGHFHVALWLGLTAVAAVAGWAGGRAAKAGLYPDSRTPRHLPSPPPAIAGPRELQGEPRTPPGKWMTRVKAADSHDFAALLEELDTLLPKEAHSTDREAAQKWLLALWITRDADQTGFLWLFDSALQSGPGDRQTRGGGVERTRAARAAFRSCATENAIV